MKSISCLLPTYYGTFLFEQCLVLYKWSFHHPPPQIQHLLPYLLDRRQKYRIALPGGVGEAPVFPVAAGQGRALDVAAHCHDDVHGGQVGQQFAVLGGFHVDAVNLLHQAHGILVDLRLYLGPGGVALEGIGGQGFAQSLGDLAAAGIVDADEGHLGFAPVDGRKRAALADALVVLGAEVAGGHAALHRHAQLLPCEVDGSQDRQPGIPLAAPRPAHLADGFQRPGGHAVAQAPGFGGQRCRAGHDGHVLPGADACPAGAPESAGAAGHGPAAAGDLLQGRFQVQRPARVFVGGQQRGAHHHMVFRAVHVAERHCHHLPDEGDGIGGVGRQAKPEDAVQPLGVAAVADIVAMDAAGFAGLLFVTDGALHHRILFEIFQRRAADQTFFAHGGPPGTGVFYRLYAYYIIWACGMYRLPGCR